MSPHQSRYSDTKANMTVILTIALAHAHGPPLAPTGIAASDQQAHPTIVRLTEGLAQRVNTPTEWRFLCPALWGGLPDAPLVSLTTSGVLAHGLNDAFLLTDSGTSSATNQPSINALSVIAVSGQGQNALALVREEARDALWRVEPAARLGFVSGQATSLVWHQDTVLVTALDGEGGLLLLTLDPMDGSEIERFVWPGAGGVIPEARSDGQHAWVVSNTEDNARLEGWGETRGARAADSEDVISGPVAAADGVWAGLNQTLHQLVGDTWVPLENSVPVQCLEQTPEQLLACSGNKLFTLDDQGQRLSVFFDVQTLDAPALDRMSADVASDCEVEWYRALADMDRTPTQPGSDASASAGNAACQGCASGGSFPTMLGLLTLCLLRRGDRRI